MWGDVVEGFLTIYFVVAFIGCLCGVVIGYVIDEKLDLGSYIGFVAGIIWPLSIIVFIAIGIGKLILFIIDRE